MTDDQERRAEVMASNGPVVGGGDSIPPQHRAEYERLLRGTGDAQGAERERRAALVIIGEGPSGAFTHYAKPDDPTTSLCGKVRGTLRVSHQTTVGCNICRRMTPP